MLISIIFAAELLSFKMSFEKSELYKLKFEDRQDYLFVQVIGGKDSLELSKEYWSKVLSECSKRRCQKLLIEEDLEGVLSSTEIYELAVWLSKQNFKNTFVAFVDVHADHFDSNQLGEIIATNRGFRVKLFANAGEAVKWLSAIKM